MDGVTEVEGVILEVGVTEGCPVTEGVTDGVLVTDGVIETVGVIELVGVKDGEDVTDGVILLVGVIEGVIDVHFVEEHPYANADELRQDVEQNKILKISTLDAEHEILIIAQTQSSEQFTIICRIYKEIQHQD